MDKRKLYAVMGNPVAHSLSPQIHQYFATQTGMEFIYEKILVEIEVFEKKVIDFFKRGGCGLNITLPFKERAYALADIATNAAKQARAANTLWMDGGKLHADNTDGCGLVRDLRHYVEITGKDVLILGAGGAARGIIGPLLEAMPLSLMVANRSRPKALALAQYFSGIECCDLMSLNGSYDLIINATSAGINKQLLDVPCSIVKPSSFCYDLAYSIGDDTPFVCWAKMNGVNSVGGLGMLVEQAAKSYCIWHRVIPDTSDALKYLMSISTQF